MKDKVVRILMCQDISLPKSFVRQRATQLRSAGTPDAIRIGPSRSYIIYLININVRGYVYVFEVNSMISIEL